MTSTSHATPASPDEASTARDARLRAIFDVSPFGIAASDPSGRIVDTNPAYQRMLGYTAEELRRMHFSELSDPEAFAENARVFAEVVAGLRDGYVIEKTYRRKDGQTIWARVTAQAVRDEHGALMYSVALVEDITERRRIARALAEEEQRHRTLLETLPLIVYRADPTPPFATRYVSPAIRMLGYTLEEWLRSDSSWVDAIHPEDRERVIAEGEGARRNRQKFDCEYRMIARDGSVRWFHDIGDFLYDDEGPTAWQGVMLDITERKQAELALKASEEQLRHAQKMEAIGKLAGGIAHDFNNLLTVIIGRAEFMRLASPATMDWHRDLDEIRGAAGRAAALTRQLLAYSRKQVLQPKLFALNDVVDGLLPMLERLIGEDVELVTRPGRDVAAVHADPGQLEQVLVNLVVNARDAMPDGGAIVISTRNEHVAADSELSRANDGVSGPFVVLSVTDTGVGMDEATMSRIFEPFFTTKGVGHGTGLGLSTAYGIAKQSGGFITVRSRVGAGASFEVFLPAVSVDTPPIEDATPNPDHRGTETILLVEDSDAVRHLAKRILRGLGYTVLAARDGREALELASTDASRIDLLLTDVVMPNLCGRQLAEAIIARRPTVKILYMSGYTDEILILKGLHDPRASFIEKPFTMSSLAAAVRQRLDA